MVHPGNIIIYKYYYDILNNDCSVLLILDNIVEPEK